MPEVTDHPERSRFEIAAPGGGTAIAAYELGPGVITITHVIVPQHAEGQGIAARLTEAAVASAERRGLKVIPQCPYVRAWFQRHPERAGVLA